MQSSAVPNELDAPRGVSHVCAAASQRPAGSRPSAVARLSVEHWDGDVRGIALPRPEVHLVARFGPSAPGGLDIHAFGARHVVHRKRPHGGQRTVSVRLHLGAPEAVLGAPASVLAGRIVDLADLWEAAALRRLYDRLASAPDTTAAAAVLDSALTERCASAARQSARVRLALAAADRLTHATVSSVAADLGVSERHLRRVFHETLGLNPKEFARLERFHRALREARTGGRARWATIAAGAGYYDQAHLIAEFRAISGVTPRALLGELRAAATLA